MISQVDKDYVVVNDRINSFSKKGKGAEGDVHVGLTIALCLYFFVVNMILPILPFDDSWYNTAI
jgi:phosphomevalonate kinase